MCGVVQERIKNLVIIANIMELEEASIKLALGCQIDSFSPIYHLNFNVQKKTKSVLKMFMLFYLGSNKTEVFI